MNTQHQKVDRSRLRVVTSALFSGLAVAGVALNTACVSINIGPGKGQHAKDVVFQAPSAPFKDLKDTKADKAWLNHNNGNSISFLSTCNDAADPSIEAVTQDLFGDLEKLKVLSSEPLTFNNREALKTLVEGEIDGVPTRIQTLVFKKNDCIYTLSYVGLTKFFDADRAQFNSFTGSFQAP